jgi:hypothetical protein
MRLRHANGLSTLAHEGKATAGIGTADTKWGFRSDERVLQRARARMPGIAFVCAGGVMCDSGIVFSAGACCRKLRAFSTLRAKYL